MGAYALRDAITAAGGTPTKYDAVGLWREYVTALGGSPNSYNVYMLMRQAITAKGGIPTQWNYAGLMRELVTTLGGTPVTGRAVDLLNQIASLSTPAVSSPTFSGAVAELSFAGGFSQGSSKTFAASPFPAGKPVLFLNTDGGRVFSSVTVNGVACVVQGTYGTGLSMYVCNTAVTAGNYDIVVTLDNTIGNLTVSYGCLSTLNSTTPAGTAVLNNAFHFGGVQNATSSITLGTNDLGVMLFRRVSGAVSAFGPSGALVIDYASGRGWATFSASGTPTYSVVGDQNTGLYAVGFDC